MIKKSDLLVAEIEKYHKNRFPWFFIDKISIGDKGAVTGTKVFSAGEFFSKYGNTVVPSFIIGEVLEQTALMTFMEKNSNMLTNTVSSDMEYFQEISCGDEILVKAELKTFTRGIAKVCAMAYANNVMVCKGVFVIAIPSIMNTFLPK